MKYMLYFFITKKLTNMKIVHTYGVLCDALFTSQGKYIYDFKHLIFLCSENIQNYMFF